MTIDPAQVDALGAESIRARRHQQRRRGLHRSRCWRAEPRRRPECGPDGSRRSSSRGATCLTSRAAPRSMPPARQLAAEPTFSAPAGTALLRASTGIPGGAHLHRSATLERPRLAHSRTGCGHQCDGVDVLSIPAAPVDFSGSLSANNAAVRPSGDDIALGSPPAGSTGFAISAGLLGNLSSSQLTLDATAPVAVYGPVSMTLNSLDVAAPGIDVSQGGALEISAGSITLGNPGSVATAAAGTGSVALTAAHVVLDAGAFTLSGAGSATITATDDLDQHRQRQPGYGRKPYADESVETERGGRRLRIRGNRCADYRLAHRWCRESHFSVWARRAPSRSPGRASSSVATSSYPEARWRRLPKRAM